MASDAATLAAWVSDAGRRSVALYGDVDDAALAVPYLRIINPPIWELGHVAWFHEHWVLRHVLGRPPIHDDGDALWNSAIIPHARRWTAALPSRAATLAYLETVRDRVQAALAAGDADERLPYFARLAVFHEDMHGEAFAYTRQTLGWPAPRLDGAAHEPPAAGPWPGDVAVPGGVYRLGAEREPAPGFVFDNEKWAHDVELAPFRIARAPVTQREFAAFVDDAGYQTRGLWSDAGWAWRGEAGAAHPIWWRRGDGGWQRRVFDRWVGIDAQPDRPVLHVNAHEADAWCRWAGRRLPSEAEWEVASRGAPIAGNLGRPAGDTVDVAAFGELDSAWGCRQMIGNVWEWTATALGPYDGFAVDPYQEYSEPWFGDHRVLRGGCFVTQPRLLRPTWRNFYLPDRRDVWGRIPDVRDRLTAFIVTPAARGTTLGNRVTALRWAKRLRELGWRVQIATAWTDEPCDLLIALHALKSHDSLARHAQARPDVPRVLALTGTDLYAQLLVDPVARASLALAARFVVLQPLALDELPAELRARACVIRQAAATPPPAPDQPGFTACALSHLREVKDPLLAARAAGLLPDDTRLRVVHLGGALEDVWAARARDAERASRGRWVWLGPQPRVDALRVLGGSRLLVLTSRSEGGANVVTEAIAAGVPVVSTRIAGSLGILGDDYPGYFEVGDAAGLAGLLERCEREPGLLDELRERIVALRPLVAPAAERASWQTLIRALGVSDP